MKVKTTILEILSYVFKCCAVVGLADLFERFSFLLSFLSAFVEFLIAIALCLGIGIALGVWETKLEKKRDAIKKVKRIDYIVLWVIAGVCLFGMFSDPKLISTEGIFLLFYFTIAGSVRKQNAKIRDKYEDTAVQKPEKTDLLNSSKTENNNG